MPEPLDREGSPPPSSKRGKVATGIEPGTTVDGRYVIESELGRGGMGIVCLALDTFLDRHVAVKFIAPTWAGDSDITARFQREAKALASIRSQYVVQVYAFGRHGASYFFAMEYVPGRSLKQIVTEHKLHGDTIPVLRSLTILSQIAQGIDAVHAAGIVHRDVKPSNIVIEQHTGRPVLVDFGLAVPGDDPAAALAIGTPQYMAPEQILGKGEVTGACDVYALGQVLYEMLTGEPCFGGETVRDVLRAQVTDAPMSVRARTGSDQVPADLSGLIGLCLSKEPHLRPTAETVAASLRVLADTLGAPHLEEIGPPRHARVRIGESDIGAPTIRASD